MRIKWAITFVILMLTLAAANHGWSASTEEDHFAAFTESNNEYIRQMAAGDIDALMKHYASDAIQIPPGAPTIKSSEPIEKSLLLAKSRH